MTRECHLAALTKYPNPPPRSPTSDYDSSVESLSMALQFDTGGVQRLEARVGDSSLQTTGYLEGHVEAMCGLWG